MEPATRKWWAYAVSAFLVIFFWAPSINADYIDSFTYQDAVSFDEEWRYEGIVSWEHNIPAEFTPVNAEITLTLQVVNYSDAGRLDLFSSNTNEFDVGGPYEASSKPGYIANLYWYVPPTFVEEGWQTVSFSLKDNQVDWLDDDGNINLALIGPLYDTWLGYPARFYLQSATLTASSVPIPGTLCLVATGLIGVFALRKKLI